MTSFAAEQTNTPVDAVTRLTEENESLRRQLRRCQRLATVGTITGMIVHEFNNILTPVINYAQLAESGDETMVRKAIAKAAEGGRRATEICDALLGLLRDQASEPVRTNVADMVAQSLTAIGRDPAKDGITLETDIPGGLSVVARPAELKQVIVNLVINARAAVLEHTRNGRIRIAAGADGESVTLSVVDNGPGVPAENAEKIFEPFFTTKTGPDSREMGTGLGLALCKEVIERMCGRIDLESTPGRGAAFHVTLPA